MASMIVHSEAETGALARALAPCLRPGDTVLLQGPLGAGKTAFARALIRALLGEDGLVVPSPTFSLVQPYEGRGWRILHIDLYRLGDPREAEELGLMDDETALRLVEWPERLPQLAARGDVLVVLEPGAGESERRISVTAPGEAAREREIAGMLGAWR